MLQQQVEQPPGEICRLKLQRKRASSLVTALMREGALVEREERDPVRRELAVFVRAA
ncbi:hypothetical protein [Agrobacterium tumefaciens]|uniref:hypothetical protein n=1 Tax=Agrobacterium tumefaciens TaxID=358 RepID=UPI001F19750D